ncbi:hypothetical protein LHYA1_G001835 [Lachnellula hyalina]|uniref:Uncharacterized protein n=1 Tax=Lachnellula hyalina TaxID=1316788 RepID=A0A8H8R6F1_9HELO|nr:uncharacterized protein LHYA1_G001835 [Lachnellula hyalina]TVY29414.1 hypothetical protein LHYA1_G001835 [Lachnellula hyalina]
MVRISCNDDYDSKDYFRFTFSARPSIKFCFDRPKAVSIPCNRPFKRRRALSDVDGDGNGNEGRKKRRLRLHLITSRLSRPYSQPATNIVNRSGSKVVVLGTQNKALGRSELRKAAIMNRVRMRIDEAKDFIRLEHERGRARLSMREIVLHKPRTHEPPLPPSPLGLSNYDAFDMEDDVNTDEDCHEDGTDRVSSIYSDFNIMNPITSDGDDYDYLDAIDGIETQALPDSPPQPPEETIVGMLREEKLQEGYFVQVKS